MINQPRYPSQAPSPAEVPLAITYVPRGMTVAWGIYVFLAMLCVLANLLISAEAPSLSTMWNLDGFVAVLSGESPLVVPILTVIVLPIFACPFIIFFRKQEFEVASDFLVVRNIVPPFTQTETYPRSRIKGISIEAFRSIDAFTNWQLILALEAPSSKNGVKRRTIGTSFSEKNLLSAAGQLAENLGLELKEADN